MSNFESSSEEEIESPTRKKIRRDTFVGTSYYLSPELLEDNYCTMSSDLWALGCIIYEFYYLEPPFKDGY